MTSSLLKNKHALITGTRGLALSIAHALAKQGSHITFLARTRDRGDAAVSAIKQSSPSIYSNFVLGDVGQASTWQSLKLQPPEEGKAEKAKIDILVNAAGISQQSALLSTSPEAIDEIISTNLTGTALACRWFLRNSNKASTHEDNGDVAGNFSPVIINLSSLLALQGGRGSTVYAASKAGVLGLTRALVNEMGHKGIRVNAIVPGYIETDMTKEMHSIAREKAIRTIPAGRFGTPEEVADAALFLAANQYANNCVINLDGGLSAVSAL